MKKRELPDEIDRVESQVRSYVRLFPTVFDTAKGSILTDITGKEFIDFFCGAGTLNYGHNNTFANKAVVEYIEKDGIQHSLDCATTAKLKFLKDFETIILKPRNLDYKIQFTGPTGTNAVEAAVKLAKKCKKRSHIIAFTHAYHGHTLGALSLTGNTYYHNDLYGSRSNVSHFPYDDYLDGFDSAAYLNKVLEDKSSGTPVPAAIILETVQGEGGINVASDRWLQSIERICRAHDILLIIDDIQVGNGRTGKFFSFEHSGITPDIVCLSKSIGGGLPFAINLISQGLDIWQPGEHTGTFRGNNLAFVAAASLLTYWSNNFECEIAEKSQMLEARLLLFEKKFGREKLSIRGKGMIWGVDVKSGDIANDVIASAFGTGLLMESCGAEGEVMKLMPALTIESYQLQAGLDLLDSALDTVLE